METQHLTYFKIENFKRFDSFEMSNLGQFNLIVGDNNVGKTSVLEALTFDENVAKLLVNFWAVLAFRNAYQFPKIKAAPEDIPQSRFWNFIFKHSELPIKISTKGVETNLLVQLRPNIDLHDHEKNLINNSIVAVVPNEWLKLSVLDNANNLLYYQLAPAYMEGSDSNAKIDFTSSYVPFIPANLSYSIDLLNIYYLHVNPNKNTRREFEDNLKLFIPDLEEIRPHKISVNHEVLGVILSKSNSILSLPFFGDGTVKYTRFLLEIFLSQNRRLMVDEIGSGIHFTRLKGYWKIIIQLCAKYNVQLFATTHSLECQQAFIEALEDSDMQQYQKDARNISLLENKQGNVETVTFDFEQFEYALNIGFNTRGGKV